MRLDGSCHCGAVGFRVESHTPYPFASAIDTPLPRPPEVVELMLAYAASWAEVPSGPGHRHFREYPRESIADWHARRGLAVA